MARIAWSVILGALAFSAGAQTLVYEGGEGPGKGKHVVLVSGDEEYRSEEMLPELAQILSTRHGFKTTVLFAIHPDGGYIDPTHTQNIPGTEALDSADLMVIFTRFRDLPDAQMEPIDRYLRAGKPVIGIRTSTHAFKPAAGTKWMHYGDGFPDPASPWQDGFGRLVLGEKWISHHGEHKVESTRGRIAPGAAESLILRGITDGGIWGSTDVYGVRLPLPGDSRPLVLGEVVKRAGDYVPTDLHYGMRETDTEPVAGAKNDPMMPIAWTKTYQLPEGKPGQAFTSTIGSSADFTNAQVRRLFVNAAYVLTGLAESLPAEGANADIVGNFTPSKYEFRAPGFWKAKDLRPGNLQP